MAFAFGVRPESLSDETFLMERIRDTVLGGSSGNTLYKPRAAGGVNKNQAKYTAAEIDTIMEELEELLHFFGYTDAVEDNPFTFFKYAAFARPEHKAQFGRFKELNEEVINHWMPWIDSPS